MVICANPDEILRQGRSGLQITQTSSTSCSRLRDHIVFSRNLKNVLLDRCLFEAHKHEIYFKKRKLNIDVLKRLGSTTNKIVLNDLIKKCWLFALFSLYLLDKSAKNNRGAMPIWQKNINPIYLLSSIPSIVNQISWNFLTFTI